MRWISPPLTGASDEAATWAAETLAEAGLDGPALYVATPDAGSREALAFWAVAQETGLAFSPPAAFPWTLANSPTGRISHRLAITGPCWTFVGGDEAWDEALLAAEVHPGLCVRMHWVGDRLHLEAVGARA